MLHKAPLLLASLADRLVLQAAYSLPTEREILRDTTSLSATKVAIDLIGCL